MADATTLITNIQKIEQKIVAFDFDGNGELNGGTVTVNGSEVTSITNSMMMGGGGRGGMGFPGGDMNGDQMVPGGQMPPGQNMRGGRH